MFSHSSRFPPKMFLWTKSFMQLPKVVYTLAILKRFFSYMPHVYAQPPSNASHKSHARSMCKRLRSDDPPERHWRICQVYEGPICPMFVHGHWFQGHMLHHFCGVRVFCDKVWDKVVNAVFQNCLPRFAVWIREYRRHIYVHKGPIPSPSFPGDVFGCAVMVSGVAVGWPDDFKPREAKFFSRGMWDKRATLFIAIEVGVHWPDVSLHGAFVVLLGNTIKSMALPPRMWKIEKKKTQIGWAHRRKKPNEIGTGCDMP